MYNIMELPLKIFIFRFSLVRNPLLVSKRYLHLIFDHESKPVLVYGRKVTCILTTWSAEEVPVCLALYLERLQAHLDPDTVFGQVIQS